MRPGTEFSQFLTIFLSIVSSPMHSRGQGPGRKDTRLSFIKISKGVFSVTTGPMSIQLYIQPSSH